MLTLRGGTWWTNGGHHCEVWSVGQSRREKRVRPPGMRGEQGGRKDLETRGKRT